MRIMAYPGLAMGTQTDRQTEQLVSYIAARALETVVEHRHGSDPVVKLASPDELQSEFDQVSSLALGPHDSVDNATLQQAVDLIIDRSVHTAHPRFFNQNFAGADPIAVAGDWLGSALNTTLATFEMAPVFTLMENAVVGRLAELLGYRPTTVETDANDPLRSAAGIMCPGGSTANMMALQLARHRKRPDSIRVGTGGERLTIFASASSHYSTGKAAAVLGLGTDSVIKVADGPDGTMDVAALSVAVQDSKDRGEVPFAAVATAGTTVTGAFDDLRAMATVAAEHDLWLHVDACFGGAALFSPRTRHLLDGVELTDSFVWNPHKVMGLTQQCTLLAVAEPERLDACFSSKADYLFQPDKLNAELDSGDRTFLCARRVDALKLWLTWKARGETGFTARVDHAMDLADHVRARIAQSDGQFVKMAPGSYVNVVFQWLPKELRSGPDWNPSQLSDDEREALHAVAPRIKARMQTEGTAMVGYQPTDGLNTFRLLFMNPAVTIDDVDETLRLIDDYGQQEWAAAAAKL